MPAAVHADWSQVRDTAVALNSIRDAAKQHGVSHDAAKQRAKREGWPVGRRIATALATARAAHAEAVAKANPGAVTHVTSTSDAIVKQLVQDGLDTKSSLVKATKKAAKTFEDMVGEEVIDKAQELRHVTATASTLHGWEERAKPEGGLVSVTLVRLELPEMRERQAPADPLEHAKQIHATEIPD